MEDRVEGVGVFFQIRRKQTGLYRAQVLTAKDSCKEYRAQNTIFRAHETPMARAIKRHINQAGAFNKMSPAMIFLVSPNRQRWPCE